jgi:hypothetical protein
MMALHFNGEKLVLIEKQKLLSPGAAGAGRVDHQ